MYCLAANLMPCRFPCCRVALLTLVKVTVANVFFLSGHFKILNVSAELPTPKWNLISHHFILVSCIKLMSSSLPWHKVVKPSFDSSGRCYLFCNAWNEFSNCACYRKHLRESNTVFSVMSVFMSVPLWPFLYRMIPNPTSQICNGLTLGLAVSLTDCLPMFLPCLTDDMILWHHLEITWDPWHSWVYPYNF